MTALLVALALAGCASTPAGTRYYQAHSMAFTPSGHTAPPPNQTNLAHVSD